MPPARRSAWTASSAAAKQPAHPYTKANTRNSPAAPASSSASVDRSTSNKLRLTVKAPPSKLRQATSSSQQTPIPPNPYADAVSESDATPAPAASRTARTTRNPKAVVEPDSDDVEDEDADGDEDMDEDAEGDVDQELLANEDSDEDAEGEDDDMDELQQGHPPPPVIRQTGTASKPGIAVTAPPEGPLKSVEAKELEDDDDDDELSELDDDEEGLENEEGDEEDEERSDDDNDDDDNSRSATPDLSKLTRRQRGAYEEAEDASLMALSNEAQKKKHLTAEEHAMRRAEMARRRKNLSEKRNEEEKMDTINKLLSKPAPKRRTRAEILAAQYAEAMGGTPGGEDGEEERRADPLFTRWVSSSTGVRLGVPEEWVEGGLGGGVFGRNGGGGGAGGGRGGSGSGRMVEEIG
ncbi:hypothetical protein LTR36_010520 [Oleoguttula mirabilis]|uniref:INO80 complex subunit B-like conserved region domain-containing protein n=1 Tax=Oleoguttula mirabilis TaxID=1507867 RepID=A0AAV9J4I6_9PEZI|nr:hypothetical protein LTR36_010520 [Oleoguttula mirabilis]